MPKESTALAGAFASSGKGLKETKEEKRERLEIKELEALASPAAWATPTLLAELRSAGKTALTAVNIEDIILRSTAVYKLEPSEADEPFWAILAPASSDDAEWQVVCVSQTQDHRLTGAAAFYSASHKENGGFKSALRAADALRIELVDVDTSQAALPLGHPTVVGLGENGASPYPASSDMTAPAALHVAEAYNLCQQGQRLVNARLQRGGASADEKAHAKKLLREAQRRLRATCACKASERDYTVLNRVESAVGGLRKMYLKRPEWDKRCLECGTRHSEVEKGTCKFWIRWMTEAEQAEAEAQAASVSSAPEQAEAEAKEAVPEVDPAVEAPKPAVEILGDAKVAEPARPAAAPAPKAEAEPQFAPFMPHLRRRELNEMSPEKENVV